MTSSSPAANTAIVPAIRPDYSWEQRTAWLARHAELVSIAGRGGIDVMFLGDSLTAGWEVRGRSAWASLLDGLRARGGNFGVSGDRTQQVLWRLENGEADGFEPAVVSLLIGTNNLDPGFGEPSPTPCNTPQEIVAGIGRILEVLRGRWPSTRILLHALFPRGPAEAPVRSDILLVNRALPALADGEQVCLIDPGASMLGADGSLLPGLTTDLLHLTATGYELWADRLREPLRIALARTRSLSP